VVVNFVRYFGFEFVRFVFGFEFSTLAFCGRNGQRDVDVYVIGAC